MWYRQISGFILTHCVGKSNNAIGCSTFSFGLCLLIIVHGPWLCVSGGGRKEDGIFICSSHLCPCNETFKQYNLFLICLTNYVP